MTGTLHAGGGPLDVYPVEPAVAALGESSE
jgi:hypothetical protein